MNAVDANDKTTGRPPTWSSDFRWTPMPRANMAVVRAMVWATSETASIGSGTTPAVRNSMAAAKATTNNGTIGGRLATVATYDRGAVVDFIATADTDTIRLMKR